jgi:hypothetical protein
MPLQQVRWDGTRGPDWLWGLRLTNHLHLMELFLHSVNRLLSLHSAHSVLWFHTMLEINSGYFPKQH